MSTFLLASMAGLLPVASSNPVNVPKATTTFGHWDLHYSSGNDASGARWETVNGTYSGPPAVAVACKKVYNPTTKKWTKTCGDSLFQYDIGIILGRVCKPTSSCRLLST